MLPEHCRPEAYELFSEAAPRLDEEPDALLRAATALSMHEHPDRGPGEVEEEIDRLAEEVLRRSKSPAVPSRLAHLHGLLFDELGFKGNVEDYYDPKNSYLPFVLSTRLGIPISLALVYRCVGERIGLEVAGVNAPGHFLVGVDDEGRRMLVDPFVGGRVMTPKDAYARIEQVIGSPVRHDERLLPEATDRQWLGRMILNLKNIFYSKSRITDLAAMIELETLLK